MTTHGRGGFERFWLGSVTDALLRSTHVPLLLVRPDYRTEGTELPRLDHVLIPLDGSALGEYILQPALALGQLLDADYTLLQVVDPLLLAGPVPYAEPVDLDPDRTMWRQTEARSYLGDLAAQLSREGRAQANVVVGGVVPTILEQVADRPNTVIALATHGHNGVARLLLGSVADKVIRSTTTPVLLVRPEQSAVAEQRLETVYQERKH